MDWWSAVASHWKPTSHPFLAQMSHGGNALRVAEGRPLGLGAPKESAGIDTTGQGTGSLLWKATASSQANLASSRTVALHGLDVFLGTGLHLCRGLFITVLELRLQPLAEELLREPRLPLQSRHPLEESPSRLHIWKGKLLVNPDEPQVGPLWGAFHEPLEDLPRTRKILSRLVQLEPQVPDRGHVIASVQNAQ
eukprot:scaffold1875_cov253-Pinguiococcus_pyrenoidosus.AAC.3